MTLDLLLMLPMGWLAQATAAVPPPSPPVATGQYVVVTDDQHPIRGRIAEITDDSLVLELDGTRARLPLATVQRIDRVGDSVANGVAIGAGIGALIDGVIEGTTNVYRAASGQAPSMQPAPAIPPTNRLTLVGRAGWAGLSDDEGSLGSGPTIGFGVIIPIRRRFGLMIAYDRHTHRRDLEALGPPGTPPPSGGFSGTEQLLTAKALVFFRSDKAVRPYAGFGIGYLDSERVSEFPTFFTQPPGLTVVAGPPEIYRYHAREFGLGFAAGFTARLTDKFSALADLALDISHPSVLSSARLTAGVGWGF
jgi:hypothetical protein